MDPYIGELKLVPYTFAPLGWAFCQGQLMQISQNTPLYALLGTTYGGDGVTTFALPDFRGRVALSAGPSTVGSNYALGEAGGVPSVTLITAQLPTHTHNVAVLSTAGNQQTPIGMHLSVGTHVGNVYGPPKLGTGPGPNLSDTGGNGPHENRQPFLALNYIIALEGIFPPRS